jgi:RecB family exonuclease
MTTVQSDVLKLTSSLVNALGQCGFQQSWLRRHPQPRHPFQETPTTAIGKSVHAALAELHRRGGARALSLADLHRLLARNWVREGYPDAEEERLARLRAEADLAAYYDRFGADDGTIATERSWSFYRELDGLRTEWFGRMDWVREHPEGGIEVVDWKTWAQLPTSEAVAADPVTVMYGRLGRHLAQRLLGWPGGPVRFSLLFVGQAEKVTVSITRELVREAEAELTRLAHGLADGTLAPQEGPWCAWQGGCPVRNAGQCPLFPAVEEEGEW